MKPTVSIGIRGWRADYLPEAISSVLDQSFRDFEIVVTDDSGTLGDTVAAFRDERIRYLRNPQRLGQQENARRVLGLAQGRLIGLLDDDDRLLPDFLGTAVSRFAADPALGVVFTNHFIESDDKLSVRPLPLTAGRHDGFLAGFLRLMPAPTSATLMRREVWEAGERSVPVADDPDVGGSFLWTAVVVQAAATGWPFYYVDEQLMVYRVHARQFSALEEPMRRHEVALWELFSFEDEECERLRRSRLATALLARAAMHLKQNRLEEGRRDIEQARRVTPSSLGMRGNLLAVLAAHPWLMPAARRAYAVARARRR